jgi:hypothetical protein
MDTHQFSTGYVFPVSKHQSTESYIRNWEIYLPKLVNLRILDLPTLI